MFLILSLNDLIEGAIAFLCIGLFPQLCFAVECTFDAVNVCARVLWRFYSLIYGFPR
jgi:hypothetical protein